MRKTWTAVILGTLMGGSAAAGYVFKPAPAEPLSYAPDPNVAWCLTGNPPCPTESNLISGSVRCAYPDEATLHTARSKAMAGPQERLQRAIDQNNTAQATQARKELSQIKATFDAESEALRGYWLERAVRSALSLTP